jgi:hypothetical protein
LENKYNRFEAKNIIFIGAAIVELCEIVEMVTSDKSKTSGHIPVSNKPEEQTGCEKSYFFLTKLVSVEPSKGENPGTDEVNPDGIDKDIDRKKGMEKELNPLCA